jgi:quinoprotein glucose dehydrogenase
MLMRRVGRATVAISVLTCAVAVMAQRTRVAPNGDWPAYGHDPGGMRYSPLTTINRDNVGRLTVAWMYHTRDMSDGRGGTPRSGFETTPLVVDGALYLTTAFNRVIALDPETGRASAGPTIPRSICMQTTATA